jgi:hypothetical protein
MTYKEFYTKIVKRLNKSGTEDYSSVDFDIVKEAANKSLNEWVRRQFHGGNQYKEGQEQSVMRVDDLQVLLNPDPRPLSFQNKGVYSISSNLPKDYRYYNSFYFFYDIGENCTTKGLVNSSLREESNRDALLNTAGTRPSKDFEQSFHTIVGNKIKLYHNGEFDPKEGYLIYYKSPKLYDPAKPDETFEFKDDIMELVADDTAKIIAGDVDNFTQQQRLSAQAEINN